MVTYLTLFEAADLIKAEALKQIFLKLKSVTPAEKGCISYGIYSHGDNILMSCIIESWDTQEHFEKHLQVVKDNKYIEEALTLTAKPFKSVKLQDLI